MLIAQTLAELANDAYSQNPAKGLPTGFSAVNLPGLHMHNGLYANGNAEAAVSTGELDGQQVLVLAFRGSDDKADWTNDLRDINHEYAQFAPLIGAVEAYAAAGGKVEVVGHSLGGAMAQIFMSQHAGDDHYRAATFGSPGAMPQAGVFAVEPDTRITNYVVSDDPFVFLGEHRAEIAAYAVQNSTFAAGLEGELAGWTNLSVKDVASALPFMTSDYVNDGATVVLPGFADHIGLDNILSANVGEHDPGLYISLVGQSGVPDPVLW